MTTSTITDQLQTATTSLRKTRDELQKTRKDLLTVKQQAAQQRQANDRQSERLRARFTEEAIKSLRSQVPEVYIAGGSESGTERRKVRALGIEEDLIARRQIEDLEQRRRELMDYNAALKRMSTECLNLARQAGTQLVEMVVESAEKAPTSGGPSAVASSSSSASQPPFFFQRDLFPPLNPLRADYSTAVGHKASQQHPAVSALSKTGDVIEEQVRKLRQGQSLRAWARVQEARRRMRESPPSVDAEQAKQHDPVDASQGEESGDSRATLRGADREHQEELDRTHHLLARALDKVEELEVQLRRQQEEWEHMEMHRSQGGEDRARHAAEVERQRQRYMDLCRALEEQEAELAEERQRLDREREHLMLEHSLSMAATTGGEESQQPMQSEDGEDTSQAESTFSSVGRSVSLVHQFASTPRQAVPQQSLNVRKRTQEASGFDKENVRPTVHGTFGPAKRVRADPPPPPPPKQDATGTRVIAGNEMRFITMRKQRGR